MRSAVGWQVLSLNKMLRPELLIIKFILCFKGYGSLVELALIMKFNSLVHSLGNGRSVELGIVRRHTAPLGLG